MRRLIEKNDILNSFEARYIPEPNSGCWLWIGSLDKDGYGHILWKVLGKDYRAHRLSWELFKGPLAENELILHSCDVPCCVNPDHLFKGDDQINSTDRVNKNRQSKGESHGAAKITEDQAMAIITDSRIHREIALDYDISRQMVSRIKSGKNWKHLKMGRTQIL